MLQMTKVGRQKKKKVTEEEKGEQLDQLDSYPSGLYNVELSCTRFFTHRTVAFLCQTIPPLL